MKFIHVGDLHIGKIVHEFSMLEDQKWALNELLNLIKEETPDALVIAGDLYDRSVPPADAVQALSDFFTKVLKETNTKILTIAGNHDSSERLSFLQSILEKEGLYIEGSYSGKVKKVKIKDSIFYLLPYTDPSEVRKIHKDSSIKTHEDALKYIFENTDIDENSILISHCFVGGMSSTCDSERPLSIGNVDIVSPEIFKDFKYVALGHLHRPQKVLRETIRYSGSLLKYSVSEYNQKKSVTIVNIDNGNVNIETKCLNLKRDLRVVKGYLKDLINPKNYKGENLDDYVFAHLLDEGEVVDAIGSLRGVYKNVLGLRKASREREDVVLDNNKNYKEKSIDDLFLDFYLDFKEIDENRKDKIIDEIKSVAEEVIS